MIDRTTNNTPPIDTIRADRLKATIWENQGEKGPYLSVTLAKTYSDERGKPRDTTSFSENDLLELAELARQTRGRMRELRQDRRQDISHERDNGQEDLLDRPERAQEFTRQARNAGRDTGGIRRSR